MQWLSTSSSMSEFKKINGNGKYIYQVCMLYQCPDAAQNNTKPCKCQKHQPMLIAILMPRSTSEYSTAMEMRSSSIKIAWYTNALTQLRSINIVELLRTSTESACHDDVFKHLILRNNNAIARYIYQICMPF
jgi:hypothetical protein